MKKVKSICILNVLLYSYDITSH